MKRLIQWATVAMAGALLLGLPSVTYAQATGTISGVVSDESGAVLPGATVEATNQGTGQVRTATSRSDGLYTIPLLSPGIYNVKTTLSGFSTLTRQGVRVTVTDTSRVNNKRPASRSSTM